MSVFDIGINYTNNERSKPVKRFLILLLFGFFSTVSVFATDIRYGYNAHGDYVPTSYGTEKIKYGYNAHGEYVPTAIGDQKIKYGYK